MESVEVELVGGGLAEWPSGKGPRGETIAPAAYLDVTGAEHLLDLPHQFHAAGIAIWRATGTLEADPPALAVTVGAPIEAAFRVPLDPRKHSALVQAILRDGGIYVVPTTPRLGINARLARDGSAWVAVDKRYAETWRKMRDA
jgi:hypothetical protein